MTPEQKARKVIDEKLIASGWIVQDVKKLNPNAAVGVAVREFPTDTGPVDYALFVNGTPIGVVEAKKSEEGENITTVEGQSSRYANSTFKWIKCEYKIRFAYEATDKLTRFTDYNDVKYRSRTVFSFHKPETLAAFIRQKDTIRNNMKHFPEFDGTGFRDCQITAINNLDKSLSENKPRALVQMATGAGKTFTAITAANPETVLAEFRNSYYPRIAVTVDMIATGTDVKPIECLIFMRDVRSKNYFEQMKGRGTRTLGKDDLQKVSPSATENKDHFVIVDAVGVTKSKKTETRTLERKPTVSMKELMLNVALGAKDEDTLTSLANRLVRLNSQMTPRERKEFDENVGTPAGKLAESLLNAFDEEVIKQTAINTFKTAEPDEEQLNEAQKALINDAVKPFYDPDTRDFIENIRRSHEQIIDNVNLDTVLFADFDSEQEKNVDRTIQTFHEFIEENKDEIIALRIIYNESYKNRPMAIESLKKLYDKLKSKGITVERLWDCYAIKKPDKVKRGTVAQITDLISIIRFEMGYTDNLQPFADKVNYNFMQWTLRRNAGAVHFTEEQMEWLRLIKDHIIASLSIEPDDLDLNPFDHKGGLGRFYEVFGDSYEELLMEMNEILVA